MSHDIVVTLDASALRRYVAGPVEGQSVGELLGEVRADRRRVAISAVALAEVYASVAHDDELRLGQLEWFVVEDTDAVVAPLGPAAVTTVGTIARDLGITVSLAHTVQLALTYDAQFATADPGVAATIFGPDWPVLDVSRDAFGS